MTVSVLPDRVFRSVTVTVAVLVGVKSSVRVAVILRVGVSVSEIVTKPVRDGGGFGVSVEDIVMLRVTVFVSSTVALLVSDIDGEGSDRVDSCVGEEDRDADKPSKVTEEVNV